MTFGLFAVMPVDPVSAKIGLDQEAERKRVALIAEWGLNQPVYKRYLDWAIPLFTELDFGTSWFTGEPVLGEIIPFIEKTILLATNPISRVTVI